MRRRRPRPRAAVERAAALLDQPADLRRPQFGAVVPLDQVHAELVFARDAGGRERVVALVERPARREAGRGLALHKILKRNRGVGPPHHILGHTLLHCSSLSRTLGRTSITAGKASPTWKHLVRWYRAANPSGNLEVEEARGVAPEHVLLVVVGRR